MIPYPKLTAANQCNQQAIFQKHPFSPFSDPLDRAVRMASATANSEKWCETPGLLTVSRNALFSALTMARQFCAFVETQEAQTVRG
jgi:hypothetical protein